MPKRQKYPATVTLDGVTYSHPDHVRFIIDMQAAGHQVEFYRGRSWWKGPSVNTNSDRGVEEQDIYHATKVRLQVDNMGRELVMYPKASDSTLTEA